MRIKKTIAAILTSVMMLSLAGCASGGYKKNADILKSVAKDNGAVEAEYDDPMTPDMASSGFYMETSEESSIAQALNGFSTIINSDDVKNITAYTRITDSVIALSMICETESADVAKAAVDAAGNAFGTNTTFTGTVSVDKEVTLSQEDGDNGLYYLFTSDEEAFIIYSVIGSGSDLETSKDMLEDFCDLTGFSNPAK